MTERKRELLENHLASLISEFEELESASHGTKSYRLLNQLDELADDIRELEDELGLIDCERYLPE